MPSKFEISWQMSEEGVPGGLSVGAQPKSYSRYKDMFDAAKEVRQIDDLRELRILNYERFSPFSYQREAVLRMLGRFRGKGIFGDQVGLGKTVEVGMTIAEFAERGAIQNVLLLCPNRLVFQWEQEIADKFSAHFTGRVVDSPEKLLGRDTGGVEVSILSFQRAIGYVNSLKARLKREIDAMVKASEAEKFRRTKSAQYEADRREIERLTRLHDRVGNDVDDAALEILDRYAGDLRISMLIVDEADALLSASAGKVLNIYRIVEHLSKHTPYNILLSATPIRRQLGDVYMLMKLVRPYQFKDKEDFIQNYCYGNAQLSDFTGEQLGKLKGIIDQLFTRNRLAGKNVQQSLAPLTIEGSLRIPYQNFADPSIQAAVRDAVFEALLSGETGSTRAGLKSAFYENQSLNPEDSGYWAGYVYSVFFSAQHSARPLNITPEKEAAFRASLSQKLEGRADNQARELFFTLKSYLIPPKSGHLIKFRGDDETMQDVKLQRQNRSALASLGIVPEGYENFKKDNYLCKGKFTEFDMLVGGMLAGRKVVVFSDTNRVRDLFIEIVGKRALNAKSDSKNENYFKFMGDDPKYADAVYFAVTGQEKGVNMQFCSDLIISDLSHDPNMVEQIIGRISRINQQNEMNIYVFAPENSLEHYLYNFYNEQLHLFSDWDGDNTFIIGGAVNAFLNQYPKVREALAGRVSGSRTEDGEHAEIGFSDIVEYIYEEYQSGMSVGTLEHYSKWKDLKRHVQNSVTEFKRLVEGFGEQTEVDAAEWEYR